MSVSVFVISLFERVLQNRVIDCNFQLIEFLKFSSDTAKNYTKQNSAKKDEHTFVAMKVQ